MVLWELTLATAYILGLKRTYRLALRAQRRVLGTKYPRIRDFTERRTRDVFRVAFNVHKEIQRRDISVGRNLGNWLLRMLDRARPQANIRGTQPPSSTSQSGPGRPSQPRFQSNAPKASESKSAQAGRSKKNCSVEANVSSYSTHVRRPIGSNLRSRITNGLILRTRPNMRPLPALSNFGFWWQPVRSQSGQCNPQLSASSPLRLTENIPWVRVLQGGLGQQQRTVFRQDIALWMHPQAST